MNIKDLMIGDWVLQSELNVPVKVQSIMCHYDENIYFYHETREYISNVSKLEPIPLTEEILKKNGFIGYVYLWLDADYEKTLVYYPFEHRLTLEYGDEREILFKCQCFHVHEFQHALKMCGIEKNIIV